MLIKVFYLSLKGKREKKGMMTDGVVFCGRRNVKVAWSAYASQVKTWNGERESSKDVKV